MRNVRVGGGLGGSPPQRVLACAAVHCRATRGCDEGTGHKLVYIEWEGCFVGRLGNFPICHLDGMWERLCKIGHHWSVLVRNDGISQV